MAGIAKLDPWATVRFAIVPLPPLALKLIVRKGVHLAQNVALPETIVSAVICTPPVAAEVLNQPLKTNPVLVGFAGRVPIGSPNILLSVVVAGVPPLPLNVRVNPDTGDHCAWSMISAVTLLIVAANGAYAIPLPFACVFQPVKI